MMQFLNGSQKQTSDKKQHKIRRFESSNFSKTHYDFFVTSIWLIARLESNHPEGGSSRKSANIENG